MKKIICLFSLMLMGAAPMEVTPDTEAEPAASASTAPRTPSGRMAAPCPNGCINPVEAVTYASYLAPKGAVTGDFALDVQSVGQQNGIVYLNSEKDYRSRNCLTIAMPIAVARMITGAADFAGVQAKLASKHIIVRGTARQVRIGFTDDGKPTGAYYFQVHVRVSHPAQLQFGDGRA